MRYLVTGGAGFIASHLLGELLPRGSVVVLDNFSSGKRERLVGRDVELCEGDVADPAVAAAAVQGVDAIFHLAANPSVVASVEDPLATGHANDMGTISILAAARRGRALCVHFELRRLRRRSASACATSTAPGRIRKYSAVIPKFLQRVSQGEPLVIYGDGLQTRDFIHVHDVVRGLLAAAEVDEVLPHAVNLGSGRAGRRASSSRLACTRCCRILSRRQVADLPGADGQA